MTEAGEAARDAADRSKAVLSVLAGFSVFPWSAVFKFLKTAVKGTQIVVPAGKGNAANGITGASKKIGCIVNAVLV